MQKLDFAEAVADFESALYVRDADGAVAVDDGAITRRARELDSAEGIDEFGCAGITNG